MNASRLFAASRVALVVTAMSFALRGGAAGAWATEFGLTHEQIGWVNGTAFWGFTLAMLFGGPLCDAIGLGRFVAVAFVGHLAGIALTIFAWNYWSLYSATLLFGIANGAVEAACNPLIAALFPRDKTTKLNHFHAWFPGGIVVGGLVAYFFERFGLSWKWQFASMLLPLVAYGAMFLGQAFPVTERVEKGITTRSMWAACFKPKFLLLVACMLLTASTELGPGQWIPNILTNAGVSGILVLVWITGLMAVGRQCAGAIVHKLSPVGTLLGGAILSAVGLFAMSRSTGGLLFLSATIFALGVCYFWPTMLGYVNERFPATGALGLAVMGGAGMLSVSFILPMMGWIFDRSVASHLPPNLSLTELAAAPETSALGSQWALLQANAGLETLGKIALMPVALAVVFMFLLLAERKPSAPASDERALSRSIAGGS